MVDQCSVVTNIAVQTFCGCGEFILGCFCNFSHTRLHDSLQKKSKIPCLICLTQQKKSEISRVETEKPE